MYFRSLFIWIFYVFVLFWTSYYLLKYDPHVESKAVSIVFFIFRFGLLLFWLLMSKLTEQIMSYRTLLYDHYHICSAKTLCPKKIKRFFDTFWFVFFPFICLWIWALISCVLTTTKKTPQCWPNILLDHDQLSVLCLSVWNN